ncbi:MAG: metallophosphoesterase [Candidatus Poribacteria bacterium]|nr:metallophosphoesterase [Candidatus Poribacteria bacterium]
MNTYLYPITFLLVCFTMVVNAQPKHLSQYPNEITRDGHIIVLPDHGTAYIVADLHAHWKDFNQWLEQTKLIDRIKADEDVYGIMLGDAIDYKPDEQPKPPYGDIQIVDRVMEIQQELGENGKRLIYIRGNHEFAAADTYAVMKRHGMNEKNRQAFIHRLYNGINGSYYKQFNFIERMTDTHFDFIMNLPTVVIGKNGFVAVHAGPARSISSLSDLVTPAKDTLDELLWDRSKLVMFGGYTLKHTENFLKILNANILVVGHTPVGLFSPKYMKDGVVRLGDKQLIFSTGYSGTKGGQTYIEIDLAKTYSSVDELTFGDNIHLLYPKQ